MKKFVAATNAEIRSLKVKRAIEAMARRASSMKKIDAEVRDLHQKKDQVQDTINGHYWEGRAMTLLHQLERKNLTVPAFAEKLKEALVGSGLPRFVRSQIEKATTVDDDSAVTLIVNQYRFRSVRETVDSLLAT